MSDNLEKMIRRWGRSGGAAPGAPAAPSDRCLTFDQAASIARSAELLDAATQQHLAECSRCRQLLADFREAIAEGSQTARRPLRYALPAAAAAVLVLSIGVGVFLATRPPSPRPRLAGADVGLQAEIEAGMTAKGSRTFASGERIGFELLLWQTSYVNLISLDPNGRLAALPTVRGTRQANAECTEMARLGPYRLDDTTGRETFFVVVAGRPIQDLQDRVRQLQASYDVRKDANDLAERIRSWPAEVKVIRIDHVAKRE